jgi:hypothetical protein
LNSPGEIHGSEAAGFFDKVHVLNLASYVDDMAPRKNERYSALSPADAQHVIAASKFRADIAEFEFLQNCEFLEDVQGERFEQIASAFRGLSSSVDTNDFLVEYFARLSKFLAIALAGDLNRDNIDAVPVRSVANA